MNIETRTAEACRRGLKEALGLEFPVDMTPCHARRGYDFDLRIGHPPIHVAVEVKARVETRNQALHLIFRLRQAAPHLRTAVFANWIPEPAAEEFRKAQVFFADAQGNAFFRLPPRLFLDIRGRKLDRPMKAEPGRLIEPGGLKVIHYILNNPGDAGAPLRVIAKKAGVALGTAHAVRKELRRAQWLLPAAGGKARFGELKGLLDLFVHGYALKLRPACLIGRYRHKDNRPDDILGAFAKRLAGLDMGWAVTGGMAARALTQYLEPDRVTLFVDEQAQARLAGEPMLRDDAAGNVTLLRLPDPGFIGKDHAGPWPMATPLLVYAETLQEGGPREAETAEMIYERLIEPLITHGR